MSRDYCFSCMEALPSGQNCARCSGRSNTEAPIHHLKPGTVLRDKYLIGNAIGEGGFGITYIGRDLTLDMKIAVKEYYPNGFSNRNHDYSNVVTMSKGNHGNEFEKEMQRFLNEAKILAKFCNDPGVVGVRDFFRENETAYIVMEYLDGITLSNYIKKYGPIPPKTLGELIDPILMALEEIHKKGLIHRDISPDNIMMLKNGRLKLLDFGAAREINGNKSLSVVLKPGYAPEEQYRSRGQQGSWTDVYAMCATIYKCITGITPDESMQRVFDDELKKPSQLGVQIPERFEQALMQGLSVKSSDRIQTMDILRRAFKDGANNAVNNVDIQRFSQTGDTISNFQGGNSEKTIYDDNKTEYVDTGYQKTGGFSVKNITSKVRKAEKAPVSNTDAEQQAQVRQKKSSLFGKSGSNEQNAQPQNRQKKKHKINPLLAIGIGAVLLILLFVIILPGGSSENLMFDKLPTELTMAKDCRQVLEWENKSGNVLSVEVLEDDLNDVYGVYTTTCKVSVADQNVEKEMTFVLKYEWVDNEWILTIKSKTK